jgi:hypothetical protein
VYQYKADDIYYKVKIYNLQGNDEFYDKDIINILNEIAILTKIKESNLNS